MSTNEPNLQQHDLNLKGHVFVYRERVWHTSWHFAHFLALATTGYFKKVYWSLQVRAA